MKVDIAQHLTVQNTALRVLAEIRSFITEGCTEQSIVHECVRLLAENGITQSWYHGVPAFVLAGAAFCRSPAENIPLPIVLWKQAI